MCGELGLDCCTCRTLSSTLSSRHRLQQGGDSNTDSGSESSDRGAVDSDTTRRTRKTHNSPNGVSDSNWEGPNALGTLGRRKDGILRTSPRKANHTVRPSSTAVTTTVTLFTPALVRVPLCVKRYESLIDSMICTVVRRLIIV